MTLSTTTAKASYNGDGSTTAFAVPFLFLVNSDIVATLRDANGAETAWVENTQYTLVGAGAAGGGTLTVKTSPTDYTPAAGESLIIQRIVPETQETDYPEGGAFPASAHEQALDKTTMLVQQHSEELARTLVVPVSDKATSLALPIDTARASKFLSFDANGNPIAAAGTSANLGPVSAFINTLLDDADAATARTTLDALQDVFTTRGDLLTEGASGEARLAVGASGKVLGADGTDPVWQDSPLPRGYQDGQTLRNDTDADHDIEVSAGVVRDDSDAANLALTAVITKQIDAAWAVGDDAGELDTGAVAANTNYEVYTIRNPTSGVVDALFTTEGSGPTMPTGYTQKCIRGTVRTDGSSNILAFTQTRGRFDLSTPILEFSTTNPGTSAVTVTSKGPADVDLILNAAWIDGGTGPGVYVSPLSATDQAPSTTAVPLANVSGDNSITIAGFAQLSIRTDGSNQYRYRAGASNANAIFSIAITGWHHRAVPMSRAVLLAAALVALLAVDARAASFCRPRAEVLLTLMRQYGEAPVAQGLAQGGAVIEVLASPDRRTWTIIASNPAGIACLLAVGEHWEPIAHAPRGEGS